MSFLHSRNVLHGDLTGGNVLLTAAPRDPRTFQAKVGGWVGGCSCMVGVPCDCCCYRKWLVAGLPHYCLLYIAAGK
jgi:hypothetical protein